VVPSHEVFQKPFPVDLRFEEIPVPEHYRHHPDGKGLGNTIKVWKVQTKKFPEIDPGLVSDPLGFDDSPDTEFIASGLNSKGPNSVALARQANYFLWGFSASPRDMTPEARKCFLNAICYIHKFDGQKPLVRRQQSSRGWALVYAGYLQQIKDDRFVEQLFPKELRERFGKAPEKYVRFYEENLEYLHPAGTGFDADEEVKSLAVSNRKVELLDKCISMLEQGDRPDLARRVLNRYTNEEFTDAQGWRTWLEAHRGRLFFTDVGGFKFLVAPESLVRASRSDGNQLASGPSRDGPQQPDADHPVVATLEVAPARVKTGATLDVVIRVRMAPTWHIYAAGGSGGPGIPTSLRLDLPVSLLAEGEWSYPESIRGSDGQMIHEGSIEFRRKLRVNEDATPGTSQVTCTFDYQACDWHACRPPTREELKGKVEVIASPTGK
jgi:hypothetical protein